MSLERPRKIRAARISGRGFSLLEVMVIVAIIGILVLSVVQWGPEYAANNRIRSATESFRAALTVARNEASKSNRSVELVLDPVKEEWRVQALENIAGSGSVTTVIRSGAYADTGKITSPFSTSLTLIFDSFGRVSGGGPIFDFKSPSGVCQADGGTVRCLRVVLPTSGQATMCDPALSYASDPKGCKP